MFFHTKQLQYNARPDNPDPVYAKQLQELIDGKGEFEYLANPQPLGEAVEELAEVDPRVYGTPKQPQPPTST